jgi:Uncharacterised protein family (UPF0150).
MPKIIFRAEILQEGNLYVGLCPEFNISSFGETIEEAKRSLPFIIKSCSNTPERL